MQHLFTLYLPKVKQDESVCNLKPRTLAPTAVSFSRHDADSPVQSV